jgi:hypothetical protein
MPTVFRMSEDKDKVEEITTPQIEELSPDLPPRLIRYKNHLYQRLVLPRMPSQGRPRKTDPETD